MIDMTTVPGALLEFGKFDGSTGAAVAVAGTAVGPDGVAATPPGVAVATTITVSVTVLVSPPQAANAANAAINPVNPATLKNFRLRNIQSLLKSGMISTGCTPMTATCRK
jgi:hypothetical protein